MAGAGWRRQPRWKRAIGRVNGTLGEALGQAYVAQYFPPDYKADDRAGRRPARRATSVDRRLTWMPDDQGKAIPSWPIQRQDRLPRQVARLHSWSSRPVTRSATASARRIRIEPPAGQDRQAGRPHRMGHDAADGQRLLQPVAKRDRLPGRHPAAAVLRSERRRRGQLRRHRRRHRSRNHPRLRRPGQPLRRQRQAERLVDAGRPQGLRRRTSKLGAQYAPTSRSPASTSTAA